MRNNLIEFKNVTKRYADQSVLENFSLQIRKGEFLTVIGRSGCGKTTVLKLINGLISPDFGTVFVNGTDVAGTDKIALRRRIGYVIQSIGLFPHLTVKKNISYVPSLSKMWDKETESQQVRQLLETVGLPTSMADRYPSQLSGGQRQRVGIARALAAKPEIMLMDEPFGAVDEITRRALQDEMLSLQKQVGFTAVFITHDIKEALKLGTRVMIMEEGVIVQLDTPKNIVEKPASPFVCQLLGDMSEFYFNPVAL